MELELTARLLQACAAAGLVGGLVFKRSGTAKPEPVDRLATAVAALGAATLAVGAFLDSPPAFGSSLSPADRISFWRAVTATVLSASLFANAPPLVTHLLTLAVILSLGATDHTLQSPRPWLELPLQTVHSTAAAAWAGFLAMLATAGLIYGTSTNWYRAIAVAFATFSRRLVFVLLLTGILTAFLRLGTAHNLVETSYGETFLIKIWLVGAILVFTVLYRYLLLPALQDGAGDPQGATPFIHNIVRMGNVTGAVLSLGVIAASSLLTVTQVPPTQVQRHEIIMGDYYFEPGYIEVTVGEPVRIIPKNAGRVIHDLVIHGIDNTGGTVFPGLFGHYDEMLEALCAVEPDTVHAKLFPGDSVVMDFVPLRPGSYQMVCTIARHKERGMTGEVRVLEPEGARYSRQ